MVPWSVLYFLSEWAIRIVMFFYVPQRRSTAAARTWLLFIFLFPWTGLLLYSLFGRIHLPMRRLEMQQRASRQVVAAREQMGPRPAAEPPLPEYLRPIASLATRLGDFQPFGGNHIELLAQ